MGSFGKEIHALTLHSLCIVFDVADCTALDLHLVDAWGNGWNGASLSIVEL